MDDQLAAVIGGAARQAREALGLTQDQVAERLDVSVEFYSRIERGVTLPSLQTFVRLVEVLQADSNTLLGIEPAHAAALPPASPGEPLERR